jgi:hypothetical protein
VLKVFALMGNVPVRFLQQPDGLMTALRFLILATCYPALRTAYIPALQGQVLRPHG